MLVSVEHRYGALVKVLWAGLVMVVEHRSGEGVVGGSGGGIVGGSGDCVVEHRSVKVLWVGLVQVLQVWCRCCGRVW